MITRRQRSLSRASIVLFACAVAWVMGVRAPHAASFEHIDFAGKGRATLVIEEVAPEPVPGSEAPAQEIGVFEVFAKMTFGTEISVFTRGLYARSSFTLPRTGDGAVLVIDVDRAHEATRWEAGDRGLRARFYTMPGAGGTRFDGEPASGSIELEAAIVGRKAAGFRIRGWLEFVDPGPDGTRDTADDVALEVDLTLESIPSPEEIDGRAPPPPRQPQSGFCETPWCWIDDGYYDPYHYGYGCGDAEVGYDTTSDGCEGDTIDDGGDFDDGGVDDGGGGFVDDGSTGGPGVGDVASDDGCSGETSDPGGDGVSPGDPTFDDDSGCEGSDDGSSSDGCDGGDSGSSGGCDDSGGDSGCSDSGSGGGCSDSGGGSGCSDTGGGSGCGSSGCSGDTLQRQPGQGELREPGGGGMREGRVTRGRNAGVDLVGLGFFAAAIATWISDWRARRGRDG